MNESARLPRTNVSIGKFRWRLVSASFPYRLIGKPRPLSGGYRQAIGHSLSMVPSSLNRHDLPVLLSYKSVGLDEKMKKSGFLSFMVALFIATLIESAWTQNRSITDQLLGTWMFVSVISEADDGNKSEPFGSNPKGMIMFSTEGHFSLFQSKAEIPRMPLTTSSTKATSEEAVAICFAGTIAYYGTYSVSEPDNSILVKVNASTFANGSGRASTEKNYYIADRRWAAVH